MTTVRNTLVLQLEGKGASGVEKQAGRVAASIAQIAHAMEGVEESSLTSTIKPTDIAKLSKAMDALADKTGNFTEDAKAAARAMEQVTKAATTPRRPQPPPSSPRPRDGQAATPAPAPARRPAPAPRQKVYTRYDPEPSEGQKAYQKRLAEMPLEERQRIQKEQAAKKMAALMAASASEDQNPMLGPSKPNRTDRWAGAREMRLMASGGDTDDEDLRQLRRDAQLFKDELDGYGSALKRLVSAIDADATGAQAKRLMSARMDLERKIGETTGYLETVSAALASHDSGAGSARSFLSAREEAIMAAPEKESAPKSPATASEILWQADRIDRGTGDGGEGVTQRLKEMRAQAAYISAAAAGGGDGGDGGDGSTKPPGTMTRAPGGTRPAIERAIGNSLQDINWTQAVRGMGDSIAAAISDVMDDVVWEDVAGEAKTGRHDAVTGNGIGANDMPTGKFAAVEKAVEASAHDAVTGVHAAVEKAVTEEAAKPATPAKTLNELKAVTQRELAVVSDAIEKAVADEAAKPVTSAKTLNELKAVTQRELAAVPDGPVLEQAAAAADDTKQSLAGAAVEAKRLADAVNAVDENEQKIKKARIDQVVAQKALAQIERQRIAAADGEQAAMRRREEVVKRIAEMEQEIANTPKVQGEGSEHPLRRQLEALQAEEHQLSKVQSEAAGELARHRGKQLEAQKKLESAYNKEAKAQARAVELSLERKEAEEAAFRAAKARAEAMPEMDAATEALPDNFDSAKPTIKGRGDSDPVVSMAQVGKGGGDVVSPEDAVARERAALELRIQAEKAANIEAHKVRLADKAAQAYEAQYKALQQQYNILVQQKMLEDRGLRVAQLGLDIKRRERSAEAELSYLVTQQGQGVQRNIGARRQVLNIQAEILARSNEGVEAERQRLALLREESAASARLAATRAKLDDPKQLQVAVQQQRAQRELAERVRADSSTMGDDIKGVWQGFAGFIGPFSAALQTGISFAWYLKNISATLKAGVITNELKSMASAMREFGDAKAVADSTGGIMTEATASHSTIRGTLMGFRGEENVQVAQIAKAAAQMKILTGEADDLAVAMAETMKEVQTELRAGEVGEALKLAGAHADSYQLRLRQEAARRGVLVESLDEQTKAQLLLAQAADDAKGRLIAFRTEGLEGLARLDSGVEDFKAKVVGALAGTVGGDGWGGEAGMSIADREARLQGMKSRYEQSFSGDAREAALGAGGAEGMRDLAMEQQGLEEAIKAAEEDLQRARDRAKQMAVEIINQDTANFLKQFAMSGEEGLDQVELLLRGFDELTDEAKYLERGRATGNIETMKTYRDLIAQSRDNLAGIVDESSFFSDELVKTLRLTMSLSDLESLRNKLRASELDALSHGYKSRAAYMKRELEVNKELTQEQRAAKQLELERLEIEIRRMDLAAIKGQTAQDMREERGGEAWNEEALRAQLEIREKQLAVEKERESLLSDHDKKWMEAHRQVVAMRQVTHDLRTDTLGYHAALGQAASQKYFETLSKHAANAGVSISGLTNMLGGAVGAMDKLAKGAILTDNTLARLFMEGESKLDQFFGAFKGKGKKEGGRSSDDDFLLQMRRKQLLRQMDDIGARENAKEQARAFVEAFAGETRVLFDGEDISSVLAGLGGDGAVHSMDLEAQKAVMALAFTLEDAQRKYKDNAAKLKAAHIDFIESAELVMRESSKRQSAMVSSYLREGWNATVEDGKEFLKLAKEGAEWWAAEYKYTTEKIAAMQVEQTEKAMLDGAKSAGSDFWMMGVGERGLTDGEKDAQLARANLKKELETELASHRWSVDQKLMLEQSYQIRLLEMEREYNQLRVDENERLRQQNIATAEQWLAESQQLMASFSNEARSQAEAGQATFKGGLSQFGLEMAEGLDIATVSLMGVTNAFGEVEKANLRMEDADANGLQVWSGALANAISAGGKFADSVIKDERKKAGIKGAVHSASALGEYAAGNIVGGTMHALAATKFFMIAGTASESPAKAKKAEATKKTALSATTVALSRDRGPTAITNVFVQLEPISGRAIVGELNGMARTSRGTSIDARLMRPTATVRTDL